MILRFEPEISEIENRSPARFILTLQNKLFYWFFCAIRTKILFIIMYCQHYELLSEMWSRVFLAYQNFGVSTCNFSGKVFASLSDPNLTHVNKLCGLAIGDVTDQLTSQNLIVPQLVKKFLESSGTLNSLLFQEVPLLVSTVSLISVHALPSSFFKINFCVCVMVLILNCLSISPHVYCHWFHCVFVVYFPRHIAWSLE